LFDVGFKRSSGQTAPFFSYTGGDRIPQLLKKIPRNFPWAGIIPDRTLRLPSAPTCEIWLAFIALELMLRRKTLQALWGDNPTVDYRQTPPDETSGFSNERFWTVLLNKQHQNQQLDLWAGSAPAKQTS
jgi:hypothetical protein